MSLADDIAADVAAIFAATDEFAKSAVYRPKAGGSLPITAIVIYGENLAIAGGKADAEAHILLQTSQVAMPKVHDEIDIAGVTWSVDRILSGDGFTWKVAASRDLRSTFKK
jgi:hypothetical protein